MKILKQDNTVNSWEVNSSLIMTYPKFMTYPKLGTKRAYVVMV